MNRRVSQGLVVAMLVGMGCWLIWAWESAPTTPPYELIEDGLYIGQAVPAPPLATQAVVNLRATKDPYEVEYELHLPILEQGSPPPSLAWLEQVVRFIDEHRRAERTVFVHCESGTNRSATAVIAYLMFTHGWSRDEAFRYVQRQRPAISPNPVLMRLLGDWEKHIKKLPPRRSS